MPRKRPLDRRSPVAGRETSTGARSRSRSARLGMGERPVNEPPRDGTSPALSAIWLAEPFVAHERPTFDTGVQARVGLPDLPVGASARTGVPKTGVLRADHSHRLRTTNRDAEAPTPVRPRPPPPP